MVDQPLAQAQAQYRVDIGTYDGQGGSVKARQFLRNVDRAIAASGITGERMASLVQSALRGDANLWLETKQGLHVAGLDAWVTLRPLLEAQYCRTLHVAELALLERQLEHRQLEQVSSFYI